MKTLEMKKMILAELKGCVQQELAALKARMEGTKKRMIEAPGAMQSHHDTSKVETGWLMDGFGKQAVLLEGAMQTIEHLSSSLDRCDERVRVTVGALIKMTGESGGAVYYLIINNGQGRKVQHDGIIVTAIDPSAAIASLLIGKEAGDIIVIKGKEMELSEII
jgi:hypothetical protein